MARVGRESLAVGTYFIRLDVVLLEGSLHLDACADGELMEVCAHLAAGVLLDEQVERAVLLGLGDGGVGADHILAVGAFASAGVGVSGLLSNRHGQDQCEGFIWDILGYYDTCNFHAHSLCVVLQVEGELLCVGRHLASVRQLKFTELFWAVSF